MADYYCDWSHTNNGNGDGWADQVGAGGAFNSIPNSISGGAGAGDRIFVRGSQSSAGTETWAFQVSDPDNPTIVLGVKAATSATPPAQSDLVPGLATGDTTRAYDQTGGNAAPDLDTGSGAGAHITITGHYYMYGLKIAVGGGGGQNVIFSFDNSVDGVSVAEECQFWQNHTRAGGFALMTSSLVMKDILFKNSKKIFPTSASSTIQGGNRGGRARFHGVEFQHTTNQITNLISGDLTGYWEFIDCDMSDLTATWVNNDGVGAERMIGVLFQNCHKNASSSILSGKAKINGWIAALGCEEDGTAKTAGESRQSMEIYNRRGKVLNEATAVRTGGASDRADGGFSWAMTPDAGDTQDNYAPLYSPWIHGWIRGDGTSKTLTVYIANSGSGDYQDDEAWIEAYYPSEAGGAQHAYKTTRMGLLGTATNITDDTESTWGTGASNPQKLELSIAPDYSGPIYARVAFAKNFASSPETLYVDPKIYGIPGSHQFMTPGGLVSAPVAVGSLVQ